MQIRSRSDGKHRINIGKKYRCGSRGGLGARAPPDSPIWGPNFSAAATPLRDVGKISAGPSPYTNPGSAPEIRNILYEKQDHVCIEIQKSVFILDLFLKNNLLPLYKQIRARDDNWNLYSTRGRSWVLTRVWSQLDLHILCCISIVPFYMYQNVNI